ncbi:hypothetical protein DNTS_003239, partial [Danionella cerebrum]
HLLDCITYTLTSTHRHTDVCFRLPHADKQPGIVFNNGSSCSSFSNTTLNSTLTCAGIHLSDGQSLKAFSDAVFDFYTLLRSRQDVSQVVSYINDIRTNGASMQASLSDVDFTNLWFQVKLRPFLSSVSKETLSCLSQANFTCQSFQQLVQDLSLQISPERKSMVYYNFIKPFLLKNSTDTGCVNSSESSETWLQLNFQSFSEVASLADFKAVKPDFNGIVVLNQLTPQQKAELVFQLESTVGLSADVISLIFQSFLQPLTNMTLTITNINSDALNKTNESAVRTETVQLIVNWTLTLSNVQFTVNTFNMTAISEWFQNVVIPVMKNYLVTGQTLPDNTTDIFNSVFALDPPTADPTNICQFSPSKSSCQILHNGESLVKAINCIAQSNLSFTEENLQLLSGELSKAQMEQILVEALPVLTLAQLDELVFSPPARPEDRANILTRVFDFLLQTPNREKLYNIVIGLQTEARMANFSCENYKV